MNGKMLFQKIEILIMLTPLIVTRTQEVENLIQFTLK